MSYAPTRSEPGRLQYLILEMWQQVYQTKFHNAKELNSCVLDMKQSDIDDAFGHQLRVIDDA